MANLIFGRPTDNVSPVSIGGGVDWVVESGTEDAAYPAANLTNGRPSKPAKLTTTTGAWVRDFSAAQQVDWVFIPMHNLSAGLTDVLIQANATNAWSSPSLSVAMTVPTWHEDGFPPGFWVDLTSVTPRSYRFWRFAVLTANASAVAIGEIMLFATKRQLLHNIHWDLEPGEEHDLVEHITPRGVSIVFDEGVKVRELRGMTETTQAGFDAITSWRRSCHGRVRPTAIVLDPAKNDAMLVRWADKKLTWREHAVNTIEVALQFTELSRGLPL